MLGAPRLHHTIATGEMISKEAAGEYARATFAAHWHPLVDEALAYWRGEPADPRFRDLRDLRVRAETTADFVLDVASAATAL